MTEALRILPWLGLCLGFSALTTVYLQRFAMLRSPLMFMRHRPSLAGEALSALTGIQINALFLLLTCRALLSCLLTCALFMLLVTLNRIKERILREPLVLSDAWLIPQIVLYPDMYFPYLPKGKMAVGSIAALFLIGLEVFYEQKTDLGAVTILILLCLALLPFVAITLLRLDRKSVV
jgi:hypothetical protein